MSEQIPADNLLNLGEEPATGGAGGAADENNNPADAAGAVVDEALQQQPAPTTAAEDLPPAPSLEEDPNATSATGAAMAAMAVVDPTQAMVDGLPHAPTALGAADTGSPGGPPPLSTAARQTAPGQAVKAEDDDEESKKRAAAAAAGQEEGDDEDAPLKKKLKKKGRKSSNGGDGPTAGATSAYNAAVVEHHHHHQRGHGPMPTWNDMFFALMAFKSKLGSFNVPAQTKLGKWVTKQRQEYSKLNRNKIEYTQCSELSEERIQVLDSLGFIWDTMLHENGRRWNQRFEELKQWKEEHGHCNVPQSTSLGQWVKIQRENKREADLKAAGKLPQRTKPKPCLALDRIEKLNSIGFQWRVAAPVTGWDNRYNQLLDYAKSNNGDVNVPQYYPADKAFGRWVMKQRSEYSLRLRGLKSQLTDERVEKLNAIGFSWVAPNFKRKVGVGIAPGSPAANVAAAMQHSNMHAPGMSKLPPMDKHMLAGDPGADGQMHSGPAAATAALAPPQDPTQQQHHLPAHHQQQPPSAPQMVHHPHQHHTGAAPPPMDANESFQALHDPHHAHHLNPHPHNPADQGQHNPMHPHHQQQQPEMVGDEVVNMEFL